MKIKAIEVTVWRGGDPPPSNVAESPELDVPEGWSVFSAIWTPEKISSVSWERIAGRWALMLIEGPPAPAGEPLTNAILSLIALLEDARLRAELTR